MKMIPRASSGVFTAGPFEATDLKIEVDAPMRFASSLLCPNLEKESSCGHFLMLTSQTLRPLLLNPAQWLCVGSSRFWCTKPELLTLMQCELMRCELM